MVRRRSSSGNDSTELQQHLTKEDIEWQIPHAQNGVAVSTAGEEAVYSNDLMDSDVLYASVSSKAPPKSHLVPNFLETDSSSRDPLMSSCADTDGAPITKNGGIDYSTEAPPPPPPPMSAQSNIYQEVRPPMKRRMTNSSAPNLAKLRGTPGTSAMELDSNPIYESSANIEPDKQVLVQPAGAETTTTEEKPDALYAQPIKRKPSAPKPSTPAPETSEPIYSEALTPAMFKQPPPDPSVPLHPYGPIYAEPTVAKKTDAVREVDVANFEEKGLIGIGQFGEVMLAETVGLSRKDLGLTPADDDRSISIKVAIKKLQSDAQAAVRENFDKEIRFMSKLHDDNIIMLLAVGTGVEPFIVMEYMENGDLHQYLEEYRDIVTTPAVRQGQIPLSVLVYMAKQVASGMRYLASHNYVHRDLATRNCLVGKDYTVKIADFGMSRNLYSQSYYKVRGRAMLPIRWMAPESFFGRFSEKTDIWSFGVVMWEIFTLCKQQPYEEMTDQEVIQDATKEEGRALLDRPEACPEGVYDVMMSCWVTKSQERAGFAEVLESLTAIYRSM